MAVGTEVRASKTLKRTLHRPTASAPTHATQNIASKPDREQAESPKTNTESWTWLNAMARAQKGQKEHREAQRRSAEKIKSKSTSILEK